MLPTNADDRKATPVVTGVLDYFPLAIAEVARVSKVGNDQHNPGEPLHWARGKSTDHADCIVRHLMERGTIDTDGMRHSAKVAWRALALLQTELEELAEEGDTRVALELDELAEATLSRVATADDLFVVMQAPYGGAPHRWNVGCADVGCTKYRPTTVSGHEAHNGPEEECPYAAGTCLVHPESSLD